MDEFPEISEPFIDFITLDIYLVAALPTYLAIGCFHRKNNQLQIKENCYLKIYSSFYELWFLALENMKNYLQSEQSHEPVVCVLIEWLTNSLSWKGQFDEGGDEITKTIYISLDNKSQNETIIKLNAYDFDKLCNAIQQLLFKPFCYKQIINITFQQVISYFQSIENGDKLISKLNYQKTFSLLKEIPTLQSDNDDELLFMSELLIRHKNELLICFLLKNDSYLPNLVLKRYSKNSIKGSKKKRRNK